MERDLWCVASPFLLPIGQIKTVSYYYIFKVLLGIASVEIILPLQTIDLAVFFSGVADNW